MPLTSSEELQEFCVLSILTNRAICLGQQSELTAAEIEERMRLLHVWMGFNGIALAEPYNLFIPDLPSLFPHHPTQLPMLLQSLCRSGILREIAGHFRMTLTTGNSRYVELTDRAMTPKSQMGYLELIHRYGVDVDRP